MRKHATTPTKAAALATRPPVDTLDVLGRARRVLWGLKLDGKAINPTAAAAVGPGRHGKAGKAFAAGILQAVGAGAGEGDIDAAIVKAFFNLKGTP